MVGDQLVLGSLVCPALPQVVSIQDTSVLVPAADLIIVAHYCRVIINLESKMNCPLTFFFMISGASKFNTIHSSVNKRNNAGLIPLNHYESAGPPTKGPLGGSAGGNGAAYHLSTLGRSSSVRGPRDPLIPSSASSSSGSGGNGPLGERGGMGGSGLKNPQAAKVVDSAYGTTRSSKKVYL